MDHSRYIECASSYVNVIIYHNNTSLLQYHPILLRPTLLYSTPLHSGLQSCLFWWRSMVSAFPRENRLCPLCPTTPCISHLFHPSPSSSLPRIYACCTHPPPGNQHARPIKPQSPPERAHARWPITVANFRACAHRALRVRLFQHNIKSSEILV